jgi:hypothetical protein
MQFVYQRYVVSVRKLGYTPPPSRRDGMLVENASQPRNHRPVGTECGIG